MPVPQSLIPKIPEGAPARASFAQERIWFLEQLSPGAFYNQLNGARIRGKLDPAVLEKCILQIVERHGVLSSCLKVIDGQLLQVASQEAFSLNFIELKGETFEARVQEAEARALADAIEPFDLSRGPMIRVKVFRLDKEDHLLAIFTHHSAFDGWSIHIFFKELAALYDINSGLSSSFLPPLPISYADFAFCQRSAYEGGLYDKQYEYWRKKLGGKLPVLDLPTDQPKPPVLGYEAGIRTVMISPELTTSLKALGRKEGATLFMVLLSAFYTLLYRYSNQDDLIVGCPIAGRNMQELEDLIGMFVNTLAIRADLSDNPDFILLLSRVRGAALEAYSNQDAQFDKLVEDLKPERDLGRNPIFQAFFQLRNLPQADYGSSNIKIEPYDFNFATAKFDLTLDITETPQGLLCRFEYPAELFNTGTMQRMTEHWEKLIEGIAISPSTPIPKLPILTQDERQKLLVDWNQTDAEYPLVSLHKLFEEQASRTPDAIALTHGNASMKYRDLNSRANQLARYLIALGVSKGDMVGVYMDRSMEMVTSFLAILKAGGTYVPISPTDPQARVAFLIEDSKAKLLIALKCFTDRISKDLPVSCIDSDQESAKILQYPDSNLDIDQGADSIAYVIYTSGSTGRPKGVCAQHSAVTRLIFNTNYIRIMPDDVIAHVSNPTFDNATFEIFGAILNGARVAIIDKETVLSPSAFRAEMRAKGVTIVVLTTTLFNLIATEDPSCFASARDVLFIGEPAAPQAVRKVLENGPPKRLLNVYGSTENTVFSTFYEIKEVAKSAKSIPIGRPISNTKVYLLDKAHQPVGIGMTGEIYLGGKGLAKGYLLRPELNAETFISDPFDARPSARIYKTGDLARYLPDGNLNFIGRMDYEVKIRGFRVELGEIEATMAQHSSVRGAVVATLDNEQGEKYLVAYILPTTSTFTSSELRIFLRDHLPEYMVPSVFIPLNSFPLTSSGKVDRKALPPPPLVERIPVERSPTEDYVDSRLKKIWEDILQISPITMSDNFFDLGGHSLMAVRLFSKIESEFGVSLPIATLFQAQTVEEMARLLKSKGLKKMWDPLVPLQVEGRGVPLFLIHAADGDLLNYYELVRNYGKDRPIYGIQARGINGETAPLTSIEAMATEYLNAIRAVQPRGPYLLLGYSAGAATAYEMAQQLEETGDEVGFLGIIDFPAPGQKRSALALRNEFMVDFLNLFVNIRSADPKRNFINLIRYFPLRIMQVMQFGLHALGFETRSQESILPYWASDLSDARKLVVLANIKAVRTYRPGKYSGTITIFRETHPLLTTPDPLMGWENLTDGKVDCMTISGIIHGSLLRPPQVRNLAKELRRRIDLVEKKG